MRFPPPDVVASWPAPNYANPSEVRRPYQIPVDMILIGIASLMVLLRIYTRAFINRSIKLDDWLVIVALIPAVGLTVTISLACTRYGWNRHIWDYEPTYSNLVNERAISWASQMLYVWSSSLTKLSLLAFYRRLFTLNLTRKVVLGMTYFVLCYFVACVLFLLLECRPLTLYFNLLVIPEGTGGTCVDEDNPLLVAGIINVLIDVIILVLPIQIVLKLKIQLSQKLQVLSVFMAGIFVVACATIRVVATFTTTRLSYDVTWDGYLVWMWVGIEVDIGLICASVPACKSLFKAWGEKLQASRDASRLTPNATARTASNGSSERYSPDRSDHLHKDILKDVNEALVAGERRTDIYRPSTRRLEEDDAPPLNLPSGRANQFAMRYLRSHHSPPARSLPKPPTPRAWV